MIKKGQISIELLIVLLFLITFIYVYNALAEQTVYSLELTKIKEQTKDVTFSLNEFLQLQKGVLFDSNLTYTSRYLIPEIVVASKKVPCEIKLYDTGIVLDVNSSWIFSEILDSNLSNSFYDLPSKVSCGQEISCINQNNKIKCV